MTYNKEIQKRYYDNHREERIKNTIRWRAAHPEAVRGYSTSYNKKYWASITEEKRQEQYTRKKLWYQKNRDKVQAKNRLWQLAHKDRTRHNGVERTKRNRITVLAHYSKGTMECKCCKENTLQFLSIDHVNGGGNKHRQALKKTKTGTALYYWLIKQNFPDGYAVLCMNCNWGKRMNGGICPHQSNLKAM